MKSKSDIHRPAISAANQPTGEWTSRKLAPQLHCERQWISYEISFLSWHGKKEEKITEAKEGISGLCPDFRKIFRIKQRTKEGHFRKIFRIMTNAGRTVIAFAYNWQSTNKARLDEPKDCLEIVLWDRDRKSSADSPLR